MSHHATCTRCGRTLTDPASVARGVGPVCARRIRAHAALAIARHTPAAVDKALVLIADGGITPAGRWQTDRQFRVVSSDGSLTYLVDHERCTCRAARFGLACYHRAAVDLLAA